MILEGPGFFAATLISHLAGRSRSFREGLKPAILFLSMGSGEILFTATGRSSPISTNEAASAILTPRNLSESRLRRDRTSHLLTTSELECDTTLIRAIQFRRV